MKQFYSVCIVLLISTMFTCAQEDRATFHVKAPPEKRNGISFSIHCDGTDTVFKEIFISGANNFLIYWGKMDSPTSASFKSDTNAVNTVKALLTSEFVHMVENCSDSSEDFRLPCSYTLTTIKDGVVRTYDAIPANEINNKNCAQDRLKKLAGILQRLYYEYHFPR